MLHVRKMSTEKKLYEVIENSQRSNFSSLHLHELEKNFFTSLTKKVLREEFECLLRLILFLAGFLEREKNPKETEFKIF